MSRVHRFRILAIMTSVMWAIPAFGGELKEPVRLQAEGKPIDTPPPGHAAPFIGDFDGDSKPDLLVGQFADGKLRIYKNVGTNTKPRYAAGFDFKIGKEPATVPTA